MKAEMRSGLSGKMKQNSKDVSGVKTDNIFKGYQSFSRLESQGKDKLKNQNDRENSRKLDGLRSEDKKKGVISQQVVAGSLVMKFKYILTYIQGNITPNNEREREILIEEEEKEVSNRSGDQSDSIELMDRNKNSRS